MPVLPEGWRVYSRSSPEQRLRRLKARFGVISRRYERAMARRRSRRVSWIAIVSATGLGALAVGALGFSPFPPMATLRHIAAAPNCYAAQAVGLAPALRGQPGYWRKHDRDGDGTACEPWSGRRW